MKRIVSGIMLTLLLLGIMMTLTSIIEPVKSEENNWWNSEWIYRREIIITERSNNSLVNFPVEVTFEHMGRIQTDGDDIRVIDNGIEVPYAIESINNTHTTIVFEVNVTAFSTKQLYIYYGNQNAEKPAYPLVPVIVHGDQKNGNATIDNRVFIGWEYAAWGVQPGWYIVEGQLVYIDNNPVVLWSDFRLDFDKDRVFETDEDLITDIPSWKGGIARYHFSQERFVGRSYGLGDFIGYVQTPVYVQLNFADTFLRVYRGQNFVETVQADRLQMESSLWDYARYQGGYEQNIIDGLDTNGPPNDPTWNTIYHSPLNPGWMAFRNSLSGYIFGAIGLNINISYVYHFAAKESHAYDRIIIFDGTDEQSADPHDQPSNCRIYWYADGTNSYNGIDKIATILLNSPLITISLEEIVPEFPSTLILALFILVTLIATILLKSKKKIDSHF